jgi:hypothetical protein
MPEFFNPYYRVSVQIPNTGGQAITCRIDIQQDTPTLSGPDIASILQAIAAALQNLGYTDDIFAVKVFIDEEDIGIS